jgi:regulator of protease activity HflC (stomatin/prohibitin superfamily)
MELKNKIPMLNRKTGSVIAVIIVVLLLISSIIVIQTGTVGVKSTAGKYTMDELQPGLHLVFPIVQKVTTVDIKVHIINYKGNSDLPDKSGVINKPFINVLDSRGLPVQIELTVQYKLLSTEAAEMYAEWGKNWEEKQINPTVREDVRDVIGNYPAEQLPEKRAEISTKIENNIRKSIEVKTKNKVQVVGVQLRDINIPQKIKTKIEEVQIAKQEVEKVNQQIAAAKKQQEKKRIEAETLKIQKVVAAKAEAERRIIDANATASKIKLEADAQAYANKKVAKSISDKILSWKKLEVVQIQAEALKSNPNTTIFVGTPTKSTNLDMWLPSKK